MLDASTTAQLKTYLEKVTIPIELVASLDDTPKSAELAELLTETAALSDKVTYRRADDDPRRPSFRIERVGTDIRVQFAGIPMGHEFSSYVLALLQVGGHPVKVSDELAPTRVWSFGVNGKLNRGTGVSEPMVVNQGDRVEIKLVNGANEKMDVRMPHSIDFHSSEVAPNKAFVTIPPGETHTFRFTAKHPGVYMYHCATAPVLHHAGAGMVGMMVVKPKDLAPVDRELWITQQEYYLGEPGEDADMAKMEAKEPDVIAFNGYAAQYDKHPIKVNRGERIRMYVLNAGPSIWSAFHVIGTVFDKAVTDNGVARDVQTINLAPSQGGYVEFTLDEEGSYPFVTHAFADTGKGASGTLVTKGADAGGMEH